MWFCEHIEYFYLVRRVWFVWCWDEWHSRANIQMRTTRRRFWNREMHLHIEIENITYMYTRGRCIALNCVYIYITRSVSRFYVQCAIQMFHIKWCFSDDWVDVPYINICKLWSINRLRSFVKWFAMNSMNSIIF